MGRYLTAASLFLLPLAAQLPAASAQQQAQPQAQAAPAEDPNRIVCRSERFTGTRIASRRTCRTAAEWNSQARVIREALDSRANRPVQGSSDAPPTVGGAPSSPFIPPR